MSPIMIGEPLEMLQFVKILVYQHLPEMKLSLRTALYPIIYYFATIQHPMTILVF